MRKVGFAVVAYFVFTAALSAVQTKSAAIYGTVRDSSGRVLAGVGIQLKNRTTKAQSTATTNEAGEYRIELPPGSYYMLVEFNFRFEVFDPSFRINENEALKKDVMLPEEKPPVKRTPAQEPKGPLPEGAIPPPR